MIKKFFKEIYISLLMLKHGKKCGWVFDCSNCNEECYFAAEKWSKE